jgi:hypothetical protein
MIPRSKLESAAFWHEAVCLDCGAAQGTASADTLAEGAPPVCSECESDAVYSAEFILRCADSVEAQG